MLQIPRVIPVALLALALSVIGGCSSTRAPISPDADAGSKPDSGGGSAVPGACGKLVCAATATCEGKGASAKCVCGDGYRDAKGNGTKCDDINECVAATSPCDAHAVCANTKGSYTCTCDAPVYVGDGKKCGCAPGYEAVGDTCIVSAPTKCTRDSGCDTGHCVSGVCCATACDEPASCQLPDDATCEDGANCVYAAKPEGTVCEDGEPCTTGDVCTDGECKAAGTDFCDDSNVCTDDTCETGFGCVNDGRGVATTTMCQDDDLCGKNYQCKGDVVGTCEATLDAVVCTVPDTECRLQICDPTDGICDPVSVKESKGCEDGDGCTAGETCVAGDCTGGNPVDCGAGTTCTAESCVAGACQTTLKAGPCDDLNPCTENDQCTLLGCAQSIPVNCTAKNDECNVGVCDVADGSCDAMPVQNGTPCNGHSSCSLTGTCQSGTCIGSAGFDACGSINVIGCTAGNPNVCMCSSPYVNYLGQCVPDVNECAGGCGTAACSANATCVDPSATCNNRVCTCKAGFSGNGLTCTDINECAGNPCGTAGTGCSQPVPGAGYSCTCGAGFTSVDGTNDNINNPTCVCDMNGTYAIRIRANITIPAAIDSTTGNPVIVVAAGTYELDSWAIRNQTYNASGSLQTTTIPCGGETPDACGTGLGGVGAEAYAQFLTNQIWGTAASVGTMPTESLTISLPDALPTKAYATPLTAAVVGIHLDDPVNGPWPGPLETNNTTSHVGTLTDTGDNGSYWVDHDNDTKRAVTSYAAAPGGTPINGSIPDPPFAYGATSSSCAASGNGTLSYNWWPVPAAFACDEGPFNAVCRVKEFQIASRTISKLTGTINSCNDISGAVTGPKNGQIQTDARVGGCRRRTGGVGSDTEVACTAAMYGWVDRQPQTQSVTSASFVIRRVPGGLLAGGLTCAEVRESMNFD